MAQTICIPVCLFPYIKRQLELQARWIFQDLQYKCLWENHDLTVLPVIRYIILYGRIYTSCFLSYITNGPLQGTNWTEM
jgi:hypothetical protein